jgi:F0F1-type ATP synthase delta subunit
VGDGLDWPTAAKRDLEGLGARYAQEPRTSAALSRIASSYGAFLKDQSKLPILTEAINDAPPELANLIPNPKRVQEQKRELADRLLQTRALLQ